MVTVYSRAPLRSSVWGGHGADGADHNEAQGVSARAIHDRAFGLQKACKRRSERRDGGGISLQITGGRTWIRTRDLFLIRQVGDARLLEELNRIAQSMGSRPGASGEMRLAHQRE